MLQNNTDQIIFLTIPTSQFGTQVESHRSHDHNN